MIAISISIVSIILSSINPDFYNVSEVCTGLPLSRNNVFEERNSELYHEDLGFSLSAEASQYVAITIDVVTGHQTDMYFGIAVFTALNFNCFKLICVCYAGIFVTTVQTAKQAGRTLNNKQERKMAIKMGAIVISDLACWAPIIILSILVQSGRHIVLIDCHICTAYQLGSKSISLYFCRSHF